MTNIMGEQSELDQLREINRELLEALKLMVTANNAQFGDKLTPTQKIATKQARAAIAKAERKVTEK